jgi:hypothetical protein
MVKSIPGFPRSDKPLAVGRGSYWYRIWEDEYKSEGGILGYRQWVDANNRLRSKRGGK